MFVAIALVMDLVRRLPTTIINALTMHPVISNFSFYGRPGRKYNFYFVTELFVNKNRDA